MFDNKETSRPTTSWAYMMKYSFNSQGTETNTGAQSMSLVWRIMYSSGGSEGSTNSVSVIINDEDKDNDNDASDSKE